MSENILRIGLFGVGRGHILWDFCKVAKNAKLVAVCDKWQEGIEIAKQKINDDTITYYDRFYEPEQVVELAIKDMKKGRTVSILGLPVRAQVKLVKHVPTDFVMSTWCKQQGK